MGTFTGRLGGAKCSARKLGGELFGKGYYGEGGGDFWPGVGSFPSKSGGSKLKKQLAREKEVE